MSGLQILALSFALVLSYFTFLNYKRGEFTGKECLGWFSVWLVFGAVTLYPEVFSVVSKKFGAFRALDFFTIVGFCLVLSISFYTYVQVDRLRKRFERAISELALKEVPRVKRK